MEIKGIVRYNYYEIGTDLLPHEIRVEKDFKFQLSSGDIYCLVENKFDIDIFFRERIMTELIGCQNDLPYNSMNFTFEDVEIWFNQENEYLKFYIVGGVEGGRKVFSHVIKNSYELQALIELCEYDIDKLLCDFIESDYDEKTEDISWLETTMREV